MSDVSKARRNVSVKLGIWSVTLCMMAGLIMKMRPLVILGRSAISFAVSATLGYVLVSVIQIHSRFRRKPPDNKPKEQAPEANVAGS